MLFDFPQDLLFVILIFSCINFLNSFQLFNAVWNFLFCPLLVSLKLKQTAFHQQLLLLCLLLRSWSFFQCLPVLQRSLLANAKHYAHFPACEVSHPLSQVRLLCYLWYICIVDFVLNICLPKSPRFYMLALIFLVNVINFLHNCAVPGFCLSWNGLREFDATQVVRVFVILVENWVVINLLPILVVVFGLILRSYFCGFPFDMYPLSLLIILHLRDFSNEVIL